MESKTGYFIDIINGKVETAEEHDERILTEFARCLGKEKCDCYDEDISLYFLSEYLNKSSERRRRMKITNIDDESLTFDDGSMLITVHEQDCCESHYLDFSVMKMYNINKYGHPLNVYEQEFDFSKGVPFKRVEDTGIILFDTDKNKYLICGYGYNNGYYGTNIDLRYCDKDGHIIYRYDVSECQKIQD